MENQIGMLISFENRMHTDFIKFIFAIKFVMEMRLNFLNVECYLMRISGKSVLIHFERTAFFFFFFVWTLISILLFSG